MTLAAPTVVTIEGDSAWIVMLAVSTVTLIAVLVLRRCIRQPGGLASGLLLSLPLVLPLIAAVSFDHAAFPVVNVLRPISAQLMTDPSQLLHVLFVPHDKNVIGAYALHETAGAWMLWIGLSVSSLMLVRRAIGTMLVRRLIGRSRPLTAGEEGDVRMTLERLTAASSLARTPAILVMPEGSIGAFAVAGKGGRILISPELLDDLDRGELEGILAHEIAHLEAKDVPLTFAAGFLRDLVAWNPIVHVAYRRLLSDREIEADHRAVTLTGDPLAVASGLVRLCELRKRRRIMGPGLGVAFGGGRVPTRVGSLLALADGATPLRTGSAPYLVAALLVAVIGMQAGAHIASQDGSAYLIMLGSADEPTRRSLWAPSPAAAPRAESKEQRLQRGAIMARREPTDPIAFKAKFKLDWIEHWKRKSRSLGLAHETTRMWELLSVEALPGFYRLAPEAI
ncbi:MAG TPA: M56 family metallopeptidase [Actinomycetota bacterium]|nr:M56 family metallopeptidase [Actinomycetota bacterium]